MSGEAAGLEQIERLEEEKQADLEVLLAYKHEKRRVELEDKLHQAKNTVERGIENYAGSDDVIPLAKERLKKLNSK